MDSFELSKVLAERYLPTIINQFGLLVLRDAQGKVTASGSAIFLDVDGLRLIVTAHHVASQLVAGPGDMSLLALPPAEVIRASSDPMPTSGFRINREDHINFPQAANLDFAAFRVSREIASCPHLRWIEASGQLKAIEFLRHNCQREREPFLLLISGFPKFARLTDTERRTHSIWNFQCWGYLQQVIEAPPILFSNANFAPQMIFEIDVPSEDDIPDDSPAIVRQFARDVQSKKSDNEPLGGYSGAPVFYLTPEAYYLVGVIKEGRHELAGRTFATAIDDIVRIIKKHDTLGRASSDVI